MTHNTNTNFDTVLQLLKEGNNLFITGVAGSGKSYLLTQLKEHFGSSLHLTATTGISAININGLTINSWAKLGIGELPAQSILNAINKDDNARERVLNCRYLAIDEISMFSDKMLTLLHQVLVLVRGNTKPFGGIQLLLFGDFLQLPPVLKKDEQLCLGSAIWMMSNIKTYLLTTNFRQAGDTTFFSILKDVRKGINLNECYNLLRTRIGLPYPKDVTRLVSTKAEAKTINDDFLSKLTTELRTFDATYEGSPKVIQQYQKVYSDQEQLQFKVDAKVMLTYNLNLSAGLINGLLGTIISFDNDTGYPVVSFENNSTVTIKPFTWTVQGSSDSDDSDEEIFSFKQIPLQLAWATTIHKSQGCTFSQLHIDLSRCFAPGQAYVALSRVKSLDGLFLEPFNVNNIKVDSNMTSFYNYLEAHY